MNYYQILKVSRNSSPAQIKASFVRLAKLLHPDSPGGGNVAKFRLVRQAYEVLSENKSRNEYDRGLGSRVSVHSPEFHRAAQASMRHKRRGPIHSVDDRLFNVKVWNAWHYGDGAIVKGSVTQKRDPKDGDGGKHSQYYARKAARAAAAEAARTTRTTSETTGRGHTLRVEDLDEMTNDQESTGARKDPEDLDEKEENWEHVGGTSTRNEETIADPHELLKNRMEMRRAMRPTRRTQEERDKLRPQQHSSTGCTIA